VGGRERGVALTLHQLYNAALQTRQFLIELVLRTGEAQRHVHFDFAFAAAIKRVACQVCACVSAHGRACVCNIHQHDAFSDMCRTCTR